MQLEQVIQCILFSTAASLNYLLELYKSCFRTAETSVNGASCAGLFLFYQEIKVLQQLDHPNIVQYLGSDIIEDRFCIYLEYVHPGSINNYVCEHYRSVTESVVKAGLSDLSLKGSPHWMAPEVLLSMMRKDSKPELAFVVDIWSVGCTVIEMLTGKPPWCEFSGVQNCNIQLRNSLVKALLPGLDRLKDTRAGRNLDNKILDLASPRRR
ncbi:hypothetical protein POM88_000638 [Heracleum sosnowskyi]|uniref:Protein kinase domain-containing protein n=1 Tax=Heracleum sosnowskyi TaxID=360622 RepID=A0AAD8JBX7_9APIA|nr:hypothetical protein POM88_000638 [Heracleum sosnowskyi]